MYNCKSICTGLSNAKKQKYTLGLQTYCSVCEKMFFKKDNPNIRCICCHVKLRNKPRTRSVTSREKKYIEM